MSSSINLSKVEILDYLCKVFYERMLCFVGPE